MWSTLHSDRLILQATCVLAAWRRYEPSPIACVVVIWDVMCCNISCNSQTPSAKLLLGCAGLRHACARKWLTAAGGLAEGPGDRRAFFCRRAQPRASRFRARRGLPSSGGEHPLNPLVCPGPLLRWPGSPLKTSGRPGPRARCGSALRRAAAGGRVRSPPLSGARKWPPFFVCCPQGAHKQA